MSANQKNATASRSEAERRLLDSFWQKKCVFVISRFSINFNSDMTHTNADGAPRYSQWGRVVTQSHPLSWKIEGIKCHKSSAQSIRDPSSYWLIKFHWHVTGDTTNYWCRRDANIFFLIYSKAGLRELKRTSLTADWDSTQKFFPIYACSLLKLPGLMHQTSGHYRAMLSGSEVKKIACVGSLRLSIPWSSGKFCLSRAHKAPKGRAGIKSSTDWLVKPGQALVLRKVPLVCLFVFLKWNFNDVIGGFNWYLKLHACGHKGQKTLRFGGRLTDNFQMETATFTKNDPNFCPEILQSHDQRWAPQVFKLDEGEEEEEGKIESLIVHYLNGH